MVKAVFVFLFIAALAGCKSWTDSPEYAGTTPGKSYSASSTFSYLLNGTSVSRATQDAQGAQTQASATLQPNWLFGSQDGSKLLTIDLLPDDGTTIELQIQIHSTKPATYLITPVTQEDSATAFVSNDNGTSYTLSSGVVNISSFDTVQNTVSGTFAFVAKLRKDTTRVVRLSAGQFDKIGVYVGGYGQGYMTAHVENSYFSSTTSDYSVAAYIYEQSNGLHIQAHAMDDAGDDREITLYIENPSAKSFTLGPQGYGADGTTYTSSSESTSGGYGTVGTLSLTKFDTVSHRLSGTFHFTAPDVRSGRTITISNGVLENVQWFVL